MDIQSEVQSTVHSLIQNKYYNFMVYSLWVNYMYVNLCFTLHAISSFGWGHNHRLL